MILDQSDGDSLLRNTTNATDFMPNCTTAEMIEAVDGHLSLIHSTFANDEDIMETGDSVRHWKDSLRAQVKSNDWFLRLHLSNAYQESMSGVRKYSWPCRANPRCLTILLPPYIAIYIEPCTNCMVGNRLLQLNAAHVAQHIAMCD